MTGPGRAADGARSSIPTTPPAVHSLASLESGELGGGCPEPLRPTLTRHAHDNLHAVRRSAAPGPARPPLRATSRRLRRPSADAALDEQRKRRAEIAAPPRNRQSWPGGSTRPTAPSDDLQ